MRCNTSLQREAHWPFATFGQPASYCSDVMAVFGMPDFLKEPPPSENAGTLKVQSRNVYIYIFNYEMIYICEIVNIKYETIDYKYMLCPALMQNNCARCCYSRLCLC